MHGIFKVASQVRDFPLTDTPKIFRFYLNEIEAEGCSCVDAMVISTKIMDEKSSDDQQWLEYITLLLGGHADIHDQAFKIMHGGIWLCIRYEDKNVTVKNVSIEIDKQLSLTRYFKDVIRRFGEKKGE